MRLGLRSEHLVLPRGVQGLLEHRRAGCEDTDVGFWATARVDPALSRVQRGVDGLRLQLLESFSSSYPASQEANAESNCVAFAGGTRPA